MTVQEAYDFYGDSIQCIYYSSTGYKTISLVPSTNRYYYHLQDNPQTYGQNIPEWVRTSTLNYCVYYAVVNDYSANPSYLGISINPNVHFSGCNALRFCAATYIGSQMVSTAAYNESFIRISGATELRYTNTSFSYNDIYPYMDIIRSGGSAFRVLPVWCDYTSDTLLNVNMLQVGFNGGRLDGGEIDVYLSCPLINDSAVPSTGTAPDSGAVTTAPIPSYNVNVTVDVDLSPLQTDIQNVASDVVGIGNDVSGILGILGYEETETLAVLDLDPLDTLPTLDYVGALETADAILDDIPEVLSGSAVIFTMLNSLVATNSIWLVLFPVCMMLCLASWVIWRR